MSSTEFEFEVVVVGAGSAGAVVAARLSEDPSCRVVLLEAGTEPPPIEGSVPAALLALQLNKSTDWMYTADPGGVGLGLTDRRMMMPRGRMLGGSSGINFMAYVRGHPGDFDSWAAGGATGWSSEEVLPYFRKSEGLSPCADIVVDAAAHSDAGPLGVSVRQPVLPGAVAFVAAAEATGIPRGDYNGRDRGGPTGVVSLLQTSTRNGRRSSTYHAFLAGEATSRPNLTIITDAQATRVLMDTTKGTARASGVEYRTSRGDLAQVHATREVVLCGGAIGSPHLMMLSGIGPRSELEAAGVACLVDSPHVGKHLKDHLHVPLVFPAAGVGQSLVSVGVSLGPDALRAPAGPLPADPDHDAGLPAELAELRAEAQRQLDAYLTTGRGIPSSSFYDASCWFSTGLGDEHTHDAQITAFVTALNAEFWHAILRIDPDEHFADAAATLSPEAENIVLLANPVQPHSEGEIRLIDADPDTHPDLRMNYLDDPHDVAVMVAVIRRALEIAEHWPADTAIGSWLVPPRLAAAHRHSAGERPSDALLEDVARHYALTVYHPTSTCRIGSVVDPRLRVFGVEGLRVADAAVMPNVISGNTNAPSIMIGEKAAEMIAIDHGIELAQFVGTEKGETR